MTSNFLFVIARPRSVWPWRSLPKYEIATPSKKHWARNDNIKTSFVIPAQAGIQDDLTKKKLDASLRWYDIQTAGFTLLEILIALFIFTILSMMLLGALHIVIETEARTEQNAARLRHLQLALVMLARDIEQIVDRPILDPSGKEQPAFIGTPKEFTFTHLGFTSNNSMQSSLARTRYSWHQNTLWRVAWLVLDQAPQTKSSARSLLSDISKAHFQYLDHQGRFHNNWPFDASDNKPLPRAVKVFLTISKWGELSQTYVISAEAMPNLLPKAPPPPK